MFPLNYFLYLQIIIFLFITPGTPRIVIVSHSVNYGVKKCLWTALGDVSANTAQMILVVFAIGNLFSNNPQILNIFKRQKEIGTLLALGMEANKVVRIFVVEGSLAAFGAVVLSLILGVPFFRWFQSKGLDVSHLSDSTIPVSERIFLDIQFLEVVSSVVLVVLIMIFVAWWPVRKISKLDPTLALRGRAIA